MDLIQLSIPYDYLRKRIHPTWRSIRFGLQNNLIDPAVPKEYAVDQIGRVEEPSSALLELANTSAGDLVAEWVDRLAANEPECSDDDLRAEWLYLTLAWTYQHRNEYSDPLQRVEEIYADFGYPERIAGFVRYMPMVGPDLGSREANEHRLLDRWRRYLDESSRSVGP